MSSRYKCHKCSARALAQDKCWECGDRFCAKHIQDSPVRNRWRVCVGCLRTHEAEPMVWRANIKTSRTHQDPYHYATNNGVFGMGWAVSTRKKVVSWDDYQKLARRQHRSRPGWKRTVGWLHGEVRRNDLIWTRDNDGNFWLARITGDWRYDTNEAAEATHVVNVRACEWVEVPLDAVPGSLTNCLGVYRPVKRDGAAMALYSQHCFNRYTSGIFRYIEKPIRGDVFSFLTADACEDAVALYLQSRGYRLIPSTCKKSFRTFEYVLIDKAGHHIAAQVKSGGTELRPSEYARYNHKVFLFSATGRYGGPAPHNVECIDPQDLRAFLCSEVSLPDSLKIWVDLLDSSKTSPSARSAKA